MDVGEFNEALSKRNEASSWHLLISEIWPRLDGLPVSLFNVPVERRLRAALAGDIDGLRLIAVLVARVHRIAAGTQLDQHERALRIGAQHLVVVNIDDLDVDISEKVR